MRPTPRTRWVVVSALAILAASVLSVPAANAHGNAHPYSPGFGTSVWGVNDMKSQGSKPAYALIWADKAAADKGFEPVKKTLRMARDAGATPVIQWYYWGDAISVSCIEKGCSGRSLSQWNSLAYKLASIIKSEMGGKLAIVVLETEFNKNGVQWYEPMDGHLAKQSWIFRKAGAHTAIGFGNWAPNHWSRFDRAIGSVHYLGLQTLRSAYRQSDWEISRGAEDLLKGGKSLHDRFGKRVLVTDFAISSWKGKEKLQEREVKDIVWNRGAYSKAGIVGIVYRWMKDVPSMAWGHHGHAEKYWGLKYSDGKWKPGMDDWVKGTKGAPSAWGAYNG